MKKYLLLLAVVLLCSGVSDAQVRDDQVEQMMTKRVLNCDDIYYNAITMIPELYLANKKDTIDAIVSYWTRNCGMNESAVAYLTLTAIKEHRFKEALENIYGANAKGKTDTLSPEQYYKENIISYLTENYKFYDIQHYPEKYPHFYFEAYVQYSNFIRSLAGSLLGEPGLSPVEHFLADYYAAPDPNKLNNLRDSIYAGTALQKAYIGDRRYGGIDIAIYSGLWYPQRNLSVVGSHPYIGVNIGGCTNRVLYDLSGNIRFVRSPNYYTVVRNDTAFTNDYYVGYYLGLDMGYAFLRNKTNELALLGGVAMDAIQAIANTSTSSESNGKALYSLNLNGGVGYKLYLSHRKRLHDEAHSYLGVQVKYNWLMYDNKGGTDLGGSALTFTLLYGGVFKSYHKYYEY